MELVSSFSVAKAYPHTHGGLLAMIQAVLRLRQTSQGRLLRLRGCLAEPKWLCIENLRSIGDFNRRR